MDKEIMISKLIEEVEKLRHRQELSKTVTPDYFEPGMMEYLDKSDGVFEPETGKLLLRFEVKGTRYDGKISRFQNLIVWPFYIILIPAARFLIAEYRHLSFSYTKIRPCSDRIFFH